MGLAAAGVGLGVPAAQAQEPAPLARIRGRGSLIVGVYHDLPPFHVQGRGIDADLAAALAGALGLKPTLLPFHAGENMDDDLRNMVWKGHYLGWGPADVLLHVPVDRPLMAANPQVSIFAPYFRERLALARDTRQLAEAPTLEAYAGRRIAVPGLSLAGWLLLGAESGRYKDQLDTRIPDGVAAAQALKRGEVAAAAGQASELESVLGADPRYAIEPLPLPRAPRDGWAIGCAVKKASTDLAEAVQAAMNKLAADGDLQRIFQAHGVTWRPV